MDFETLDVLYRSRKTLLRILAARGYNTAPYEKFGPYEIEMMAQADSFRMDLELDPSKRPAPNALPKCRVLYGLPRLKTRITSFMSNLLNPEEGDTDAVDPATTEVVVIALDNIGDSFHNAAINAYGKAKLRISFYQAHTIVNNPMEYSLVPKHEYVPKSEHETMLKGIYAEKKNLPLIRFHEDMMARLLGLVPGDIVKITRPSPSAGVYTTYRVCVP